MTYAEVDEPNPVLPDGMFIYHLPMHLCQTSCIRLEHNACSLIDDGQAKP